MDEGGGGYDRGRLLVEQSQVHAFLMGRLASRESRGTGGNKRTREGKG